MVSGFSLWLLLWLGFGRSDEAKYLRWGVRWSIRRLGPFRWRGLCRYLLEHRAPYVMKCYDIHFEGEDALIVGGGSNRSCARTVTLRIWCLADRALENCCRVRTRHTFRERYTYSTVYCYDERRRQKVDSYMSSRRQLQGREQASTIPSSCIAGTSYHTSAA